ncbi:alpha/beta hydrolase [Rhodospirillales bacterium]|nr:alpha/beta hydrolase [Rhodospirillales bacterium]
MSFATTQDGVKLYFEETGKGTPIIFVHEYAGDHRSWEPQVRFFSRFYRCIAYSARGYPPSDVPADASSYSQDLAQTDILAILDHLEIEAAHIVGLSMGGFATLHFGLNNPERSQSLVVAGCGYGADESTKHKFRQEAEAAADNIEAQTMEEFGKSYGLAPTRVQYKNKDPRGWSEFETQLREHSTLGSANTMRGVQAKRPSLYQLVDELRNLTVPTLILNGDEDEPCLDVGIYLKRTISSSALVTLPKTGHASNLEEPALFNMFCDNFFHQVEANMWSLRDPRSISSNILSTSES